MQYLAKNYVGEKNLLQSFVSSINIFPGSWRQPAQLRRDTDHDRTRVLCHRPAQGVDDQDHNPIGIFFSQAVSSNMYKITDWMSEEEEEEEE